MSSQPEPTKPSAGLPRGVAPAVVSTLAGLAVGGVCVRLGFLYPICALLFAGTGLALWFGRLDLLCFLKTNFRTLLLLALPALWLQAHLPGDWQDWADETPQAAAALRIHLDREATFPAAAIFALPDGPLLVGDQGGSGLFSALAALVHDLTGERPGNVRLLNGLTAYVLLGLVWFMLRKLAGLRASLAVFALFILVPLLSLTARGGGEHLLLTTLLAAAFSSFVFGKQDVFPKLAAKLLPFATGLTAASFLLSGHTPWAETPAVLPEILFRLFSPEAQEPASPLLMTAGLASGILLIMSALRKGNSAVPAGFLTALCVLSVVGLAVSLRRELAADTPWTAPHLLPLHVAAALALAWAVGRWESVRPLPWGWLGPVWACVLMVWSVPRLTQHVPSHFLRLDGRRVLLDFAREQPGHATAFYAMDRPQGLMAEGISAGPVSLLAPEADGGLGPLLSSRIFARHFALSTATLNPRTGVWEPDAWQKLPEGLETKIVRERWVSLSRKAFVHEVLGVKRPDGTVEGIPALGSGPRTPTGELSAALEARLEVSP